MKSAEVTGKLSTEREALRKLKSIPQLDDVESLEHHVHSLRNGHHRVDTLDHQQHVLGRLPPPPVIGDVIALQALSGSLIGLPGMFVKLTASAWRFRLWRLRPCRNQPKR